MKTDRENNAEREAIIVIEKKTSPKTEALAILLIGVVMIIGFALFFLFFYRPFVPWKKIMLEREYRPYVTENAGTCIFDEDISEVTYFYEMNGVKYKKVFDMKTVPNQSWPFQDVPFTIYINMNEPTDVKQGNRGGFFLIFVNSILIIMGGYMIGLSIYKINQIKAYKKNIKKHSKRK